MEARPPCPPTAAAAATATSSLPESKSITNLIPTKESKKSLRLKARMTSLYHEMMHRPAARRGQQHEQEGQLKADPALVDKSSIPTAEVANASKLTHLVEVKKDAQVERKAFCVYTNHFVDDRVEAAYQIYCTNTDFRKAQWIVCGITLVHFGLVAIFRFFNSEESDGLDLLPRNFYHAGEYTQWIYVAVALPFALWPHDTSPFRYRWKRWMCSIITSLVIGLQLWLFYEAMDAMDGFKKAVHESLKCTATLERVPYFGGFSVQHFLTRRNRALYQAFIAISSTLLSIVGATLAVAVRTDFPHVVTVCVSTILALITLFVSFKIRQEAPLVCGYVLPAVLLCISCYNSDRTARRSFLSKLRVEEENVVLKSILHKAEEALKNDEAHEDEKLAVQGVLKDSDNDHLDGLRINFSDLQLHRIIGKGGMGEAILGEYLGTKVVCKRMLRESISVKNVQAFRFEIELMSCLRHPNIVQIIGASWDNCSNLCMVVEYMENGDLHSVLRSKVGFKFSWSDPLLKMSVDISQGMLYLHSQDPPIVHRDLKSVNILCSATYGCKISDFGLSKRHLRDQKDLTTVVGTPYWLAPEIIRNESYSIEADVFSFGIVLTELETRQNPYHDQEDNNLKVMMKIAWENLRPTIPNTCLPARRALIQDCLEGDPKKRPTFQEILKRLQGEVRQELAAMNEKPAVERRAILSRQKRVPSVCVVMDDNEDDDNNDDDDDDKENHNSTIKLPSSSS